MTDRLREARVQQRTEVWGRLYDMGYHGHAAGDRAAWIHAQLVKEGTVPADTEAQP